MRLLLLSLLLLPLAKPAAEVAVFNEANELPGKESPVMESFQTPLWHLPWMFATARLLLVSEWWLRRRHWLP